MKAISAGIAGKVSVAIVSAILGEGKEGEVGGKRRASGRRARPRRKHAKGVLLMNRTSYMYTI